MFILVYDIIPRLEQTALLSWQNLIFYERNNQIFPTFYNEFLDSIPELEACVKSKKLATGL